MEFSKQNCIGFMPDFTYGGYVYLNKNIDAPMEHHNQFLLNQEPDFYITSLSNLMNETLTLLHELFFNKMVIMDRQLCQSCVSVIKSCKMKKIN